MVDINKVMEYSKEFTLLYVEDNADAREMTAMVLENFFKEVYVAKNGKEGVEQFKQNPVDIVMSDISMPKLNGFELCKIIKSIDPSVSLVIISAHNEKQFFSQSVDVGVDGYIYKPIDIDKLTTVLYKVVTKKIQNSSKES